MSISSLKLSCSYTFSLCMSKYTYVVNYGEFVFGALLERQSLDIVVVVIIIMQGKYICRKVYIVTHPDSSSSCCGFS